MARKILNFDAEEHLEDLVLMGIISPYKDFRLCFELNAVLGISLSRLRDLELPMEKPGSRSLFARYCYVSEDNEFIYMISNRGSNGLFIQQLRPFDYFLIIRNPSPFTNQPELLTLVQKIRLINQAAWINPNQVHAGEQLLLMEDWKVEPPDDTRWRIERYRS